MTVHASKGLEFDAVFIGKRPVPARQRRLRPRRLEEERRLMYGLSPAPASACTSHRKTRLLHGQTRYNVRSRFSTNCPRNAFGITPKQQGFWFLLLKKELQKRY